MARRPALRALAARAGILPSYVAAGGRARRVTSDATRVALLAALGLDAGDEAAARRTAARLEEEARAQAVAPVQIVELGRAARLRLRSGRARAGARRFELAIEEEGGARHERSGTVRIAARGRDAAIALPALPAGVHRLRLRLHGAGSLRQAEQTLVVAPRTCTTWPERLGRRRGFGLTAQLYALRSERGLGVADLTELRALLRFAAGLGADFAGINPLHALANRPSEISPYAPVSRLFRNPVYLDVEAVPELASSPEARRLLASAPLRKELAALRRSARVDPPRTAALQQPILAALHRSFARLHRGRRTGRGRAYADFCRRQGAPLEAFATFRALQERAVAQGRSPDWRTWPAALRDPTSEAVRSFRRTHPDAVDLHAFVQFELDRQLAGAAREASRAGLRVGLYQDLAVGSAAAGFDPWGFPGLFVQGASVGAPPDEYATSGQDWGLPPLDPGRLATEGYRYWLLLLRSAFAHSGALRVDHVMGLFRQYWVPAGRPASEGAYVRFPARHLLALLALESRRHGALVVGEDLGTVPRGLPATLARWGILSSRVLYFERTRAGGFKPAARYSKRALVTVNTHDLPTLAGFWGGRDLEIRRELGEIADDDALAAARAERARERCALVRRLAAEGCLPRSEEPASYPALCAAVNRFLARTPAPLVGVSLDDLAGEVEPVNVPGVPPERHPSWTRRMQRPLAALARDPGVGRAVSGLARRAR